MKTLYIVESKTYDLEKVLEVMNSSALNDEESYTYNIESKKLYPKFNKISTKEELLNVLVHVDKLVYFSEVQPIIKVKELSAIFSCKAKKIIWVDKAGKANLFSRNEHGDKILFVFPGSVVPLNLGSHQRSFNLLSNLSEAGYSIDLLIPKPKNIDLSERIKQSLGTVTSRVFFYDNDYKKFPKPYRMFRKIEERWRIVQDKEKKLPDTFVERDYKRPTLSCKKWVNSLHLSNEYSNIIVSYAWMMPSIEFIKHNKDVKIICDTHDVQYIRGSSFLNKYERLSYSYKLEKYLERKRLETADIVLAISDSDKYLLDKFVSGKTKVITTTSGFNYALNRVKKRPKDRPMTFGFIGGSMSANILAVEFILDNWWPVIKRQSPDSNFLIAGSVGRNPSIIERSLIDENIRILGFVDNLNEFYHQIEVSLNPVIVQGGLNFKSVEAVFQGKHLITNPLGAECLGKDFMCTVASKNQDITSFLREFEFDIESDYKFRAKAQQVAKKLFSNENVMKDFLSLNNPNIN